MTEGDCGTLVNWSTISPNTPAAAIKISTGQRRFMMANDQYRPPSPDSCKIQNSKAQVRSANGGSVQRHCSATCSFHLKNLRSDSLRQRSGGRPCHCARNVTAKYAKYTKRNPCPNRVLHDQNSEALIY